MNEAMFEVTFMDGDRQIVTIQENHIKREVDVWKEAIDQAIQLRYDGMKIVRMDLLAF